MSGGTGAPAMFICLVIKGVFTVVSANRLPRAVRSCAASGTHAAFIAGIRGDTYSALSLLLGALSESSLTDSSPAWWSGDEGMCYEGFL